MDPQPPTPPPPKSHFPFVLALTSALFFASTLFLGYQNWQLRKQITELSASALSPQINPQPTTSANNPLEGWKTYKNTQYGFSLSYPSTYEIAHENPNGQSLYILPIEYQSLDENEKASESTININVLIQDKAATFAPQSFVETAKAPGFDHKREIRALTIDGNGAIQFMSNNTQAGPENDEIHTVIASNKPNQLILISVSAQGNADPYFFPNQILSTFQFIDQTAITTPTPIQTSGKQIYCPSESKGQICPTICINPPPYICGSDGKQYCSECQACAGGVAWYTTQNARCAQ